MNTTFKYKKAYRIAYRSCFFDSLLELKYALSIEQDYRYLREPYLIGYDAKTLQVTNHFKEETKIYTPDFLIRCKTSNKAYLVEIKPSAFRHRDDAITYQQIAQNYIHLINKDFQFKMVYDDDIILSESQQRKYNLFVAKKDQFADLFSLHQLDRKYNAEFIKYFSSVPFFPEDPLSAKDYARFVRLGI